jgi:hypothetical protein
MKLLFLLLTTLFLFSCSQTVKVTNAGDVDGRRVYNVKFPDGKVLDHMYAEEVTRGLNTGIWEYDEDLKLNY